MNTSELVSGDEGCGSADIDAVESVGHGSEDEDQGEEEDDASSMNAKDIELVISQVITCYTHEYTSKHMHAHARTHTRKTSIW